MSEMRSDSRKRVLTYAETVEMLIPQIKELEEKHKKGVDFNVKKNRVETFEKIIHLVCEYDFFEKGKIRVNDIDEYKKTYSQLFYFYSYSSLFSNLKKFENEQKVDYLERIIFEIEDEKKEAHVINYSSFNVLTQKYYDEFIKKFKFVDSSSNLKIPKNYSSSYKEIKDLTKILEVDEKTIENIDEIMITRSVDLKNIICNRESLFYNFLEENEGIFTKETGKVKISQNVKNKLDLSEVYLKDAIYFTLKLSIFKIKRDYFLEKEKEYMKKELSNHFSSTGNEMKIAEIVRELRGELQEKELSNEIRRVQSFCKDYFSDLKKNDVLELRKKFESDKSFRTTFIQIITRPQNLDLISILSKISTGHSGHMNEIADIFGSFTAQNYTNLCKTKEDLKAFFDYKLKIDKKTGILVEQSILGEIIFLKEEYKHIKENSIEIDNTVYELQSVI